MNRLGENTIILLISRTHASYLFSFSPRNTFSINQLLEWMPLVKSGVNDEIGWMDCTREMDDG